MIPPSPDLPSHSHRNSQTVPARLAGACILATSLLLGGCNNFSGDERQQADVVDNFYRAHLKSNAPGLPGADELRQLQPLVSRALFALLTRAEAADRSYHALAGNDAAPLVEGDLMTSLYEGATDFSVQSCDSGEQRASCLVDFRYRKDGANEAWSDKILLVQEDRQWRIDDIEFVGNDQSSQREYLSDTLTDALRQIE